MRSSFIVGSLLLVAGMLSSGAASAQTTKGRFQLGLDGTLISSESGTFRLKDTGNASADDENVSYKARQAGFVSSGLGVTVAGGAGERVVLGARVAQATRTVTVGGVEAETSGFSFLPNVEILLGQRAARPFLLAGLGYRSETTTTRDPVSETVESTYSGLAMALGFGVHAFVADRFSIDPLITMMRVSGTSKSAGTQLDAESNVFLLTVGLSGWLGGEDPAPPAPATDETPEPREAPMEALDGGAVAPPPAPAKAGSGVVARGVPVVPGGNLRVAGRPALDGAAVELTLTLGSAPPKGMASWEQCHEAVAVADDEQFALDDMRIETRGFGAMSTLRARTRIGVLIRLVKAQRAAQFQVCGKGSALHAPGRRSLLDFLKAFKRAALEHDTWDTSVGAAEGTAPPEPDSGAQPPAENASEDLDAETPPAEQKEVPEAPSAPAPPSTSDPEAR